MALQSLDIKRRSATSAVTPPPGVCKPIEMTKLIDINSYIDCKTCQVACSEWNDIRDEIGTNRGVCNNPIDLMAKGWTVIRFSGTEENGKLGWLIRKNGCMHYADSGCLKACPSPGAIVQYQNGIVDFHQGDYIGCGYYIAGCPFSIPHLNKEDNRACKCTPYSDRVAVGQEPACVKTCPTGAIQFSSKEDMRAVAQERVEGLNRRSYKNAGLYDPQGVGGTHVMYVLHHADKLGLYHGLPENPSISKTVKLWKGFLKPLAAFGIAAAALAGYFHYVTVGPNRTVEDGEKPRVIGKDGKILPREEDTQ